MTSEHERAARPEDLARLVVERVKAGDADGLAALYEPDAVLGYPADQPTVGREAIRAVYEKIIAAGAPFKLEAALPTLYFGDIALTATRPADGAGRQSQGCAPSARRDLASDHRPARGGRLASGLRAGHHDGQPAGAADMPPAPGCRRNDIADMTTSMINFYGEVMGHFRSRPAS